MSTLANKERLEKVIYQGGYFSIKVVTLIGNKNATGGRSNPIYVKSYNSTKYTDRNTLESLTLRSNDYVVFAYNNFEEKINEEIFISNTNMEELLMFLDETINMVTMEGVFNGNNISSEYQNVALQSETMGGGKSFISVPTILDGKEEGEYHEGILLFLNSDDICVPLRTRNLKSIRYILNKIDIIQICMSLIQTAQLEEVMDKLAGSGYQSKSSYNNNQFNNNSGATKTTNRRSLFNNNAKGAGSVTRTVTPPNNKQEETSNVSTSSNTETKQPSKTSSMSSLMKRAKEYEAESFDDIEV